MMRPPPRSPLFPSPTLFRSPKRELLLGKHPPEKFGCTPCHNGQGPAVNSPDEAHGNFLDAHGHVENVEFIEQPMLRAEKMQADRKSTRLNSSHLVISYAVFC